MFYNYRLRTSKAVLEIRLESRFPQVIYRLYIDDSPVDARHYDPERIAAHCSIGDIRHNFFLREENADEVPFRLSQWERLPL